MTLALALVVAMAAMSACIAKAQANTSTPANFKVAFIGDQGLGPDSVAVLELIRDEGADMVLHQGDFDYHDDPDSWDQQISDVLGPDFPYFASVGNHDVPAWSGYQQKLLARLGRVDGAVCNGDLGVRSACSYQGIFFILSGVGELGSDHDLYIREQLALDRSTWRICSWHKNQTLMQIGGVIDLGDWRVYEECRIGGAIIATGHHHTYERTHLMDNFETQTIASTSNPLHVRKGRTFAFVSGLGGINIQGQDDELAANPWWASVYTSVQGANYGASFCTLNENGIRNRAHCYFKDVDGVVPDEFDVIVGELSGIGVSMVDGPDPTTLGSDITYTLDVTNSGPDVASGITLTDTLPDNVAFVLAFPTQGRCSQTGGVVTCDIGDLSSGANATVTIVVTSMALGVLSNTANVSSEVADPDLGNNVATSTTAVNIAAPTPTPRPTATVSAAPTATATPIPTVSSKPSPTGTSTAKTTPEPTATPRPPPTPTATPVIVAMPTPSEVVPPEGDVASSRLLIALLAAGVALGVGGYFLSRR